MARRTYEDPLETDAPGDMSVAATRRGLTRLALVAAETGARFQREGVAHDPMAWMLAPRALFGGANALEACLERDACMRAILLHGLSIGLDAHPAELDALLEADDGADGEWVDGPGEPRDTDAPPPTIGPDRDNLRLFTATVVASDGFEVVQAFHASLAIDEADVAARLYMRMGIAMADAVIVEGFDPSAPLVDALVAPALRATLRFVAADPSSPLAAGLDLTIEQRFLG